MKPLHSSASVATRHPVITCPAGTLRGTAEGGIERYFGIPYAQPPIGPLRFAPAKALHRWSGKLDATRFGPASAQAFDATDSGFEDFGETAAGRTWIGNEDSLTLNIWRPDGPPRALPVIIWVHGGANCMEASRFRFYDGTNIAREGVIFVSLNYRLGIFGFLDLSPIGGPAEAHSHGLSDQMAAMDWVAANIAAFGGDPANITLMGNSAGSMDISWHIASGRLPPGVKRAVLSSGVASPAGLGRNGTACAHDPAEGHRRAADFLRDLGYTRFCDLQAASTGEILTRQSGLQPRMAALPEMETLFYPRTGSFAELDPFAAAASGAGRGLDIMIGFTAFEMGFYLALDQAFDQRSLEWVAAHIPFVPAETSALLPERYRMWFPHDADGTRAMHLLGDVVFALPSLWFADLFAAMGATVYVYRFDWAVDDRIGALHAADIAFMLGVQDLPDAESLIGQVVDQADRDRRSKLAQAMVGAVTRFATCGSPMVAGSAWPAYTQDLRQMMLFDKKPRVSDDPMGERRAWWTANVLPSAFGGGR